MRSVRLDRGRRVQIIDTFELSEPPQEITMSLVTPSDVSLVSDGRIVLSTAPTANDQETGAGQVELEADRFSVLIEEIPITDERLGGIWGDRLTRIILMAKNRCRETLGRWGANRGDCVGDYFCQAPKKDAMVDIRLRPIQVIRRPR